MNKKESHRVPWEPYKGATNADKLRNRPAAVATASSTRPEEPASARPLNSFNKEDLVRYKVDTDLGLFNAQRPGYLFDASDFESAGKQAFTAGDLGRLLVNGDAKEEEDAADVGLEAAPKTPLTPFVDARFYTDFHFMKLAGELKKKCVAAGKSGSSGGVTVPVKPVNVVGPMVEKKPVSVENGVSTSASTTTTAAAGRTLVPVLDSNSVKVWKSQRAQYESRIEYLEGQINGLNEQLQIQTQVNAELKRMLVASVGEDMQYRLERLVNDKQRLEFELTSNGAALDRMSDEIEQISIQCDLWRSKFLASKLMLDELATWKSFLLLLNRENEQVLANLLNDNKIVNDKLLRANDLLLALTRQHESAKEGAVPRYNSIQLANSILSQLSSMNIALTEKRNYERLRQSAGKDAAKFKTNNELVAEQMLEQFEWLSKSVLCPSSGGRAQESGSAPVDSLDKLEELLGRIKLKRSTTHSRLFQAACSSDAYLLLNVCNQCTGQLKVV